VDGSTTQLSGGAIIVKDGGITSAKLATNIAVAGTLGVTGTTALTGNVGIGTSADSAVSLNIAGTKTGATTFYGVLDQSTIGSGVTSVYSGFLAGADTAAASFTLTQWRGFTASAGSLGAGSAITNVTGFFAENTLTTGTNNYGFRGLRPLQSVHGRHRPELSGGHYRHWHASG
jgi:hypothetical protein